MTYGYIRVENCITELKGELDRTPLNGKKSYNTSTWPHFRADLNFKQFQEDDAPENLYRWSVFRASVCKILYPPAGVLFGRIVKSGKFIISLEEDLSISVTRTGKISYDYPDVK